MLLAKRYIADSEPKPPKTDRLPRIRLRVWAVTMSGTTGTAGGVATTAEDRCRAPWPGDGTHLQADRFRLLGVSYGWLTASITTFSVTPTTQIQQLQGQFDAGRSHHRSLHGTFTVTRAVARGRSRAARWSGPIHEVLRHGFLQRGPFLTSHGSGCRFGTPATPT
jgi:hypothetical protein